MLINTYLDTEDFVHLYYAEDEPTPSQGCGAGARMASKYPPRPPSPDYEQVAMSERERGRLPPPEPPPHRVRAADMYPRMRTHYDEPGVEPRFTPICGEFIQWVGRTSDGGTIAMSNYRLHLQPRKRGATGASVPLRLIDAMEIRDTLCLIILCKHGRQLKCVFNTGDQCMEWCRRLTTAALTPIASLQDTFAAAYAAWAKEQPPSSVHRALIRASLAQQPHWFGPEVERLGFSEKGPWRVTAANAEYKLCPSYPPLLVVPASIGDDNLEAVARFRAMRRIPAVVWRHRGSGAVIARSSQPEVGWFGARSSEDERMLAAFVSACNADRPHPHKSGKLMIVDARSYTSAVTNRARGGGCEYQQYYPSADIQFMGLPNIHHVRRSYQQMRQLAAEPSDQPNWHSNLERTLWLQNLSDVLRAACLVARAVEAGCPVLVHCSDGWDRTPQLSSAAQLLLDPHYRTRQGFRILIEREWLDFGHKFGDRCGHQFGGEDPNERSPIFLQWLHVVYQLVRQFPCSFEFSEAYLIKLAVHVHSCMFGTFLCNNGRERMECGAASAPVAWHLLSAPAYRNHLYAPTQHQVLWPECSVRSMQVWWELFSGECRETAGDIAASLRDSHHDPPLMALADNTPQAHFGAMTKTRSCDNLLCDGEKRTAQRRCSDPSLVPDVMKLSVLMNGLSGSDERVSPVAHTRTPAQVEVDPEHFEGHTNDITSNSSSLERELSSLTIAAAEAPVVNVAALIDATEADTELTNGADVPDGAQPDPDRNVFDLYADVFDVTETTREASRTRNISITWRSVSESSNQSSTFDIPENSPQNRVIPHSIRLTDELTIDSRTSSDRDTPIIDARISSPRETSPIDNHITTQTEGDLVNHNIVNGNTNHNRQENGIANGLEDVTAQLIDAEINGGVSSSGASSESDGEGRTSTMRAGRGRDSKGGRISSLLTLCPASPRRPYCRCAPASAESSALKGCFCGACASGAGCEAGDVCGGHARCVCGAGPRPDGAASGSRDAVDGLPPAADAVQARLHQIILYQKKVVEELSGQLREAREALRRASPSRPPPAAPMRPRPAQMSGSVINGSGSGSGSGSSSSGSASEVEVGEDARGVVWLPDSAAPRCQHCRNQFWLARRRHHCRRCGGIFCGSCSEMSSWGEVGAVRVCRRCRVLR
ncbi:myotubularin-related protein 4-like isoform X2 [Leptidea sinapis]|uniref:myotubularin-related protein 4-like isoform X2 n=1 Tax=Leptidea sinapis TaxID=189913 RepID=UPI0021C45A45|nr:myotubularin-related protein 4-like isoform X2 [Leptidea sinapis]